MARQTDPRLWIQQAGLLTSIPFVLLVGPVGGYYLGSLIDSQWQVGPWGVFVAVTIGLAASCRVTINLIRDAQNLEKRGKEPPKSVKH